MTTTPTPVSPTRGQGRLAGKVALITGAGSVGPGWGNGRAMAVRFAEEGARIFAVDREASALTETAQRVADAGGVLAIGLCDVTQAASIGGPIEMSEEVWDAQVDHNLKSVFLTCKHVLPHMLAQGGGTIVNMSSTSAMRWTGAAQIAYAATKAAVIQFSRVLAVQYAKQGIRVNTVVPGQLHTPMVEVRLAGQRAGGDAEALLRQRQARIPLPFMGDGRDTANAALFLASDEARFVTGTEIVVDGGMSVRCD
jgi:NAD(P)-dependent dehydrogenase (short-subunit alcohol dehydrogenase family)